MLRVGIIGTILTAICCFTPALVWLLAAIGMAGAVIYLDLVLLPLLLVFIVITGIALWKRRQASS